MIGFKYGSTVDIGENLSDFAYGYLTVGGFHFECKICTFSSNQANGISVFEFEIAFFVYLKFLRNNIISCFCCEHFLNMSSQKYGARQISYFRKKLAVYFRQG